MVESRKWIEWMTREDFKPSNSYSNSISYSKTTDLVLLGHEMESSGSKIDICVLTISKLILVFNFKLSYLKKKDSTRSKRSFFLFLVMWNLIWLWRFWLLEYVTPLGTWMWRVEDWPNRRWDIRNVTRRQQTYYNFFKFSSCHLWQRERKSMCLCLWNDRNRNLDERHQSTHSSCQHYFCPS